MQRKSPIEFSLQSLFLRREGEPRWKTATPFATRQWGNRGKWPEGWNPFHSPLPRPELAVEGAVVDGLDQVRRPDVGRLFQVGDGPCHAQDAVVRPRRQAQLVHRLLQQPLALLVQGAVPPQL